MDKAIQARRVCKLPNGHWVAQPVLLHYSKPMLLDDAIRRVREGHTVLVSIEDAPKVLEAITSVTA